MSESHAKFQLRLMIERRCREMADKIAPSLLPGTGFALFMFDFGHPGEPGSLAYVSSGDRADIVRAMKEWIARQEKMGFGDG